MADSQLLESSIALRGKVARAKEEIALLESRRRAITKQLDGPAAADDEAAYEKVLAERAGVDGEIERAVAAVRGIERKHAAAKDRERREAIDALEVEEKAVLEALDRFEAVLGSWAEALDRAKLLAPHVATRRDVHDRINRMLRLWPRGVMAFKSQSKAA